MAEDRCDDGGTEEKTARYEDSEFDLRTQGGRWGGIFNLRRPGPGWQLGTRLPPVKARVSDRVGTNVMDS